MLEEMRKRIGIFPRLLGGFACPFLDDGVVEEEEEPVGGAIHSLGN